MRSTGNKPRRKARRELTVNERVRFHFLHEGVVEALLPLPETERAFSEWRQAGAAMSSSADHAELLERAGSLVRALGVSVGDPTYSRLAAELVDRCLFPDRPRDKPAFPVRLGRRFVISEHWPTWLVRAALGRYRPTSEEKDPLSLVAGGFDRVVCPELSPKFIDRVLAQCDAAEKAARVRGRPATDYSEADRCAGRWWFLIETKRATREALGREHHASLGRRHARDHGIDLCPACLRHVDKRLSAARDIIDLARLLTATFLTPEDLQRAVRA